MTPKTTLATITLAAGGCWALQAQPAAIQQLQNNQITREFQPSLPSLAFGTNAPELYAGENLDVGPQRILRLLPRHNWFDAQLDSQAFFTDNANYAPEPYAVSSWVFVNTVQASLTPPAMALGPGQAAVALGLASQWYNYGDNRMESFDFNAQTFFLNGNYTVGKWQFGAGVNLTRLVNQENYNETYREFMPNLGVQRLIPLNRRMSFVIGDLVDFHLTEVPSALGSRTDINDRFDNTASLGFVWQPTSHLLIQPYYRFQYSNYQHDNPGTSGRNDELQSVGVTATYYFNRHVSLRAFYNYNRRQSGDPFTPAYLEMNGGPGLLLDFKF